MRSELTTQGTATRIDGPLLFLKRNVEVTLGEAVDVLIGDEPPRTGRVTSLDDDTIVIEVLETTRGLSLGALRVRFRGEQI